MSDEDLNYKHFGAVEAAAIEQDLESIAGLTGEQRVELAGLAVAQAVHQLLHPGQQVLIICGPSNAGAYGWVAARHLVLWGWDCTVVSPPGTLQTQHHSHLHRQCTVLERLQVVDDLPHDWEGRVRSHQYAVVVDAVYGMDVSPSTSTVCAPILERLQGVQGATVLACIDAPSHAGLRPRVLVSVTVPKKVPVDFVGRHFVGGRYVPRILEDKYQFRLPQYPGTSQVVEIVHPTTDDSWEAEYAAYLAEKERASSSGVKEPELVNKVEDSSESWEAQYFAYLAEKEAKEFAQYERQQR